MLAAEAYKLRLEKGLSFIEFNYQLLQAYDFLTLYRKYGCTLQMGGDDQWGNILAGIDLIRRVEGGTAEALTFPLLTTASGAKMGKTAQGAVWLDEDAVQPLRFLPVLGQLRRPGRRPLPPHLHPPAARRDPAPRGAQGQRHQRGQAHPGLRGDQDHPRRARGGEGPEGRGRRVRRRTESSGAIDGEFALRRRHRPPHDGRARARGSRPGISPAGLFTEVGLTPSRKEAKRMIEQGGLYVNDERIDSVERLLTRSRTWAPTAASLLKAGKKKVHRIVPAD